jgi:hypothetical protein
MSKKSQTEMVLEMLQNGPITALDIFKKTGSLCAAERIRDLRERGYNIITQMIDLPNGKRVGKYFLTKKRKAA